jgi:hypothetical protein
MVPTPEVQHNQLKTFSTLQILPSHFTPLVKKFGARDGNQGIQIYIF